MSYFIITLIVLSLPLLVLRLSQNFILKWLGPVVTCYMLGILIGNLFKPHWDFTYARHISEAGILLALPLFLFSVDLWGWTKLAKSTLFSFFLLIVCVVGCSLLGGWIFLKDDPETWKMAAMLTGVYIGGTANLTALGKMLDIRHDAFIALNTVDLILGGIYLLFIMSLGVKILSKFLRPFNFSSSEVASLNQDDASLTPAKLKDFCVHLMFTSLVCGLSVFFTFFIFNHMEAGWIFSFLTLLSLGLSFWPKLRCLPGSVQLGEYFLLIFCLCVGSLADARLFFMNSSWYLLFCGFIMFGSILTHFLFCFLFKIDRDTAIITSMAGIFGPAFIPAMGQVLNNRQMIVSGVTTGLVGIAIGNFMGLLVASLLKAF